MLLSAGILKPGSGTMTIEYLGQKFVADLLEDGKIRSQETDIVFASPSAWAIACKRFINPEKKSGCGWASVKYRGKKLDAYKNIWYKKKKEEEKELEKQLEKEIAAANNLNLEQLLKSSTSVPTSSSLTTSATVTNNTNSNNTMFQRFVVKHNTIANRTLTHDANTMIECVPFSTLGKIQPFLVSLHTNVALLMDFHCHLTKSEVSGYLAGHWEVNSHNLQITHAFPCRNTKADRADAPQIEQEIAKTIEKEKLTLVGWYHSHPYSAAAPTLRDVDAQLDYQIKMRGTLDNSYTPCIGIIISPYNNENLTLESSITAYWVIPPPETKPNEYGRPMLMSYSVVQDSNLSQSVKSEITKCVEYYKKESDFVDFNDKYVGNTFYIEKLKASLLSKFPRDENEEEFWQFLKQTLNCTVEEKDSFLSSAAKSGHFLPTLNAPVGLNAILSSDISSLLFNAAGKYPSPSSLFAGLPDPMAHSTLAANNMFLQSNLFKMQELLKPFSQTSSSSTKSSKSEPKYTSSSPTKTVKESLPKAADYSMDLTRFREEMNFSVPESSPVKVNSKDFSAEYLANITKTSKAADFSVSNPNILKSSQAIDPNVDRSSEQNEIQAKIPKIDYSNRMLDLSYSKSSIGITSETASDGAADLSTVPENSHKEIPKSDTALNLTGD
ncbi:hypothetical protein ABEB36_003105 [Hypothenemus hampei]